MLTRFRRLYNAIDRFLDRSSITQSAKIAQGLEGGNHPITAREAFESILPTVKTYDRKAVLKRIVSQQGIDESGASAEWEFFFDLPHRRAKLACEWRLTWDEKADVYGPPELDLTVSPFPQAESPLRQMVRDGQLLHRQLVGLWLEETRRTPTLPIPFRDTNLILVDLKEQGLDITQTEFSLSTGIEPQRGMVWLAQTRNKAFYASFSDVEQGAYVR